MKLRKGDLVVLLTGVLLSGLVIVVFLPGPLGTRPVDQDGRAAIRMLQSYAKAQARLLSLPHAQDFTGYWRKDISGLYSLKDVDGAPLKLIELDLARADINPDQSPAPNMAPKADLGYFYSALRFKGEGPPLSTHFAACAFPSVPAVSRWMYIISDAGIIYRKECPRCKPPEVFPEDPTAEQWVRIPVNGVPGN